VESPDGTSGTWLYAIWWGSGDVCDADVVNKYDEGCGGECRPESTRHAHCNYVVCLRANAIDWRRSSKYIILIRRHSYSVRLSQINDILRVLLGRPHDSVNVCVTRDVFVFCKTLRGEWRVRLWSHSTGPTALTRAWRVRLILINRRSRCSPLCCRRRCATALHI
jgi:hypothetical protein